MADFKPNKKQQECIDNINGKHLVLAGPGTGKTFTIIQIIKSMIASGTEPEKILCLAFTDTAATEMKTRIEKELGQNNVNMDIFTYHSFCLNIIENNQDEFELPANYKVITDPISRIFIKECINEYKPVAYRSDKNDPYCYISRILSHINEIKKNRLTKEKFMHNLKNGTDWEQGVANLSKEINEKLEKNPNAKINGLIEEKEKIEKNVAKMHELWDLYELYQRKLNEKKYIDFNDMISIVLDKFEKEPEFLHRVTNNYEYLLVDEYQDTNQPQNEIIINLVEAIDSQNVFVVGDDDQIIYSFQGAKLDTMERFLEKFPDTGVTCLNENMRSTQKILDFARAIAVQDENRLEVNEKFKQYEIDKNLIAVNHDLDSEVKEVRLTEYPNAEDEMQQIVKEITELVNSEFCSTDSNGEKKLSEIAILTPDNLSLEKYAEMLKVNNIPVELKDGKSLVKIRAFSMVFAYMQFLANPQLYSDKLFKMLLCQPYAINSRDYEIIYGRRIKYESFIDNIKSIDKTKCLNYAAIQKFIKTFDYLSDYKNCENIDNTILEIGKKTGLFSYYLTQDINKSENIAAIKKLLDEARAYSEVNPLSNFEEFVAYIEKIIEEGLEIKTDKAPVPFNAIQLSTYHSSKGREFEYVYMPMLISTKWESNSKKSLKPEIPLKETSDYSSMTIKEKKEYWKNVKCADLIKLLFVGTTRAKHTLRLSFAKKGTKSLTKFIDAIPVDLYEKIPVTPYSEEDTYWQNQAENILSKQDYDYRKEFKEYIDNLITNIKYSPTTINTYLSCPRQYLYSYILDLGSKTNNKDSAHYGTAVHEACEVFIQNIIDNQKYMTKEEFIGVFKNCLENLSISDIHQKEILLGRGENMLSDFYHYIKDTSPVNKVYKTEDKVEFEVDGKKFTGKIDRIDKVTNPATQKTEYIIYDYKTGKAKNEKEISPDGTYSNYYNQIALYKYFYQKQHGIKVRETVFIFPEGPDNKKYFHLELTEEECEEVLAKFKQAIIDINEQKFDKKKSENNCKYCEFKHFCENDN